MKLVFRDCPLSDVELARLRQTFPSVDFFNVKGEEGLDAWLPDAEIVVGGRWNEELAEAAQRLRWVQGIYAGVDDLPLDAFARKDVRVTNFRGVSAIPLSEHVLALMFAFARGLPEFFARQRNRDWQPQAQRPVVFELKSQRVGIVGLGTLGSAIADQCQRIGMHVSAMYRAGSTAKPTHVDAAYERSDIDAMLSSLDHLVLALPSNLSTRSFLNTDRLSALKRGAYVYNVGRGDAIDMGALEASLSSGHVAGAGLDVTSPEPLPEASPFWHMPNVIITGHTAGISPRRWERGVAIIEDNINRYVDGRPLINLVAGRPD